MKEETLSDEEEFDYFKTLDVHIIEDTEDPITHFIYDSLDVDWVKEFIKKLKEICRKRTGYRSVGMGALIEEINKLAGEKLI